MNLFKRSLDFVLRPIVLALFVLLIVLVVWQVFTRLILDNPSAWTEEAARYVFIWLSLIGIAIATGEKADVAITFLVEKTPLFAQRFFESLAYLSTMLFVGAVMVIGGSALVQLTWSQRNPILPVNAGVLYLALPVSGALLLLYLAYHLLRAWRRDYTGVAPQDPAEEVEL